LDKLATSLNRRDEVPNQELARQIVHDDDADAVKELIKALNHKDRAIQSDSIKTLYEIGEAKPDLIAKYYRELGALLDSSHQRLVWGAMMALDAITTSEPRKLYGMLAKILEVADTSGSVIARDHAVGILAKLAALDRYKRDCLPLLIEQIAGCPDNQFAMYVEKAGPVIDASHRARFLKVIEARAQTLERDSQRKRVARVLKKLI
ncbi:MAG: hypothetical protein QOK48_2534, partial [Blastocatellia bacterium]|nr:hypothetical protein [Blastocatellia bacterium]